MDAKRYRQSCVIMFAALVSSCAEQASVGERAAPYIAAEEQKQPPPQQPARGDEKPVRKEIGPNVYFVKSGDRRWVEVETTVCLREGYLEHLMSRTEAQKQHESILTASVDARHIHAALLATGAKEGKPARFFNEKRQPDFRPPSGDKIKVMLRYTDAKGKEHEIPAQKWVRNTRTKKELAADWVFAGSVFIKSADDEEPQYGANDGRVICVSNFTTALLDLEIRSDEGNPQGGLEWEANPDLIPSRGTKVIMILEPMSKK